MTSWPATIGRYEVLEEIGRGGMAVVYRARDPVRQRDVAIKMLVVSRMDEGEMVRRFEREAAATARLDHPNIVPVLDAGTHADGRFIVMELMEGGTLGQRLHEAPHGLPLALALYHGEQIALALEHAHAHGIIHRDVKPGNVLLTPEGIPRLADFGIARAAEQTTLTSTGIGLGSPTYMSPEQIEAHDIDARSDLYALGVLLFELLTGRPPFTGDSPLVVMHHHVTDPAPPVSRFRHDAPEAVDRIVARCLEKDAARRFADARELAHALHAARTALTPAPPLVRIARRAAAIRPRTRKRLFLATVAVASMLFGGLWLERVTRPDDLPVGPSATPSTLGATDVRAGRGEGSPSPAAPPAPASAPGPGASVPGPGGSAPAPAAPPAIPGASPGADRTPDAGSARPAPPSPVPPAGDRTAPAPHPPPVASHPAALPALRPAAESPAPAARPGPLPEAVREAKDGSEMRLVPAGAFIMGDAHGRENERPPHEVYLPAFYMDVHPVTVRQFRAFVQQAGYQPDFAGWDMFGPVLGDDAPVVNVSWYDARQYAAWAGRRLPTEAEYEKAARGPMAYRYPWGNEWSTGLCSWGDVDASSGTWGRLDGFEKAAPVGGVRGDCSGYGIRDLAGNVSEWTENVFEPYPGGAGGDSWPGGGRAVRGGSWQATRPEDFRCASRRGVAPRQASATTGFRTVRTP